MEKGGYATLISSSRSSGRFRVEWLSDADPRVLQKLAQVVSPNPQDPTTFLPVYAGATAHTGTSTLPTAPEHGTTIVAPWTVSSSTSVSRGTEMPPPRPASLGPFPSSTETRITINRTTSAPTRPPTAPAKKSGFFVARVIPKAEQLPKLEFTSIIKSLLAPESQISMPNVFRVECSIAAIRPANVSQRRVLICGLCQTTLRPDQHSAPPGGCPTCMAPKENFSWIFHFWLIARGADLTDRANVLVSGEEGRAFIGLPPDSEVPSVHTQIATQCDRLVKPGALLDLCVKLPSGFKAKPPGHGSIRKVPRFLLTNAVMVEPSAMERSAKSISKSI